MKKWKIIAFIIALIILLIAGTIMNYQGFKSNNDEQKKEIVESNPAVEKPIAGESRNEQSPILELTQESIEIEIGGIFNPVDYIKNAQDQYGYSVKDKVTTDLEIPTDVPGKYEVVYIMDLGSDKKIEKKLAVEVKEMKEK